MKKVTLLDTFIASIDGTEEDCIEWPHGTRSEDGRGRVSLNGKKRYAYSAVWELWYNRPVPDGMVIRHRCDNQHCCNPKHLELGTVAQNNADKADMSPLRVRGRLVRMQRGKSKVHPYHTVPCESIPEAC